MPRKFLKKWMPSSEKIRTHPRLNKIFGKLLHEPNLLHLNRRSVSGAFFVGLFMAFVPLPSQMILAAGAAIWLRVNLPLSVSLVWVSNPLTIPPLFYFAYTVGAWSLNMPVTDWNFELSWHWLATELAAKWEPFLLGCLICGVVSGIAGFLLVRLFWRFTVKKRWTARKKQRCSKNNHS